MTRALRFALLVAGSLLALTAVLATVAVFLLHSTLFQERMRRQIVSTLERETGGRVELARLDFNLPSWTIHLHELVIHGSEAPDAPALLSIPSLDVTLHPLFLFERRLKISSLRIDRPLAYLLVHSDGSTTLPKFQPLRRGSLQLEIDRLEIRSGALQINDHRHLFNLEAGQVQTLLSYSAQQTAYRLQFSSRQVHLGSDCCGELIADLRSEAIVRRNSAEITNLAVVSKDLQFTARGALEHFAKPELALHFQSQFSAAAASRLLKIEGVTSGSVALQGDASYNAQRGVTMAGHATAQGLNQQTQAVSDFIFAQDRLNLENLSMASSRGAFAGRAILTSGRNLDVQGRLENVALRQALAAFRAPRIPWNATLSGPISFYADLARPLPSLSLHTSLHFVPVGGSPSLSGDVVLSKHPATAVRFGDSHLDLPNTHLSFAGAWGEGMQIDLASTGLQDLEPLTRSIPPAQMPQMLPGGTAHFKGSLAGSLAQPVFAGDLELGRFQFSGQRWDKLDAHGAIDSQSIVLDAVSLSGAAGHATARARAALTNWHVTANNPFAIHSQLRQFALPEGRLTASLDISGTLLSPAGGGHLLLEQPVIYGRAFRRVAADAIVSPRALHLEHGTLSGLDGGTASFSATYRRASSWQTGQLSLTLDTQGLPASAIDTRLTGQLDGHGQAAFAIQGSAVRPLDANGHLVFRHLAAMAIELGNVSSTFVTRGARLNLSLSSDFAQSTLAGNAEVDLVPGSPIRGRVTFKHANLELLSSLVKQLPGGTLSGTVDFDGSLEHIARLNASADLSELTLHSPALPASLDLRNSGPVLLHLTNGQVSVEKFELTGPDTRLKVTGSVGDSRPWNANLNLDGSLNLRLLRLVSPNAESGGQAIFRASLKGPLQSPVIQGRLELQSATLATPDLPSGISAVNGVITFDNNRATVEQVTGNAGGGLVRLGGFVNFGGTAPVAYHLDGHTENVRVRSASNVSLTATTDLHLSGTAASSLLSGSATISRVVFNPSTDVGNILASIAAPLPVPANRKDFLSNLHLDIAIESAPNFQLSTALSRDVEAEIDLRLRGTLDRPLILGSISANQGDIRVFGSRYSINRGEVRFSNTSKVDPVLDLDLQTQARGITVDITIAGTLNHLNITYRSDPPLQPRDIIALLTVGRTPQEASNTQNTQIVNDTTAFHSGTNTVLGQAIAPSSNRLSKLFGITNIKIDPLVQGITNTPQARLTLEQQVSRAITVTYVTNLSQTSEQIFRLEWSLNRQYSIVAVRDDNGEFGIDFQFKRRFK